MILKTIIIKFSHILKTMSRNTFPEPKPDSASYVKGEILIFLAFSLPGWFHLYMEWVIFKLFNHT